MNATTRCPVVFISHGAPDALLKALSTVACWQAIGAAMPRPKAVLVLSAHWEAQVPTIGLSERPQTIHDFAGFARELYSVTYPAPGAPELAQRVIRRFTETGMGLTGLPSSRCATSSPREGAPPTGGRAGALATDPARGLDHGAWVPLSVMFPAADIPVAPLALPHQGDAADFLAIGTVLRPLRDEGVLILATGAITHNFGWLRWDEAESATPLPRAKEFADWVGGRIAARDVQGLADFRKAPHGDAAHPSAEHFMPLFAALGAAGDDAAVRHQPAFTYGGLAMDAYVWG